MKISLFRGIPATALFFCAMLTSFFTMAADVAGDYRSITTGSNLNWSSRTTWERYNGSTWVMPTAGEGYPGQYSGTGTVTISNSTSNTIKLNVSPANPIGALHIGEPGATGSDYGLLENGSGSRDLDITGSLIFEAYGEFSLVGVSGSQTYNLTIGGDITFTSSSTLNFRDQETGNIILNGTNQTISGGGSVDADSWALSNNGTVYLNSDIDAGGMSVGANATLLPQAAARINGAAAFGTLSGSGTVHCTRTASQPTLSDQLLFSTYTLSNIRLIYSGAGNQTIAGYTVKSLLTDGSGTKTCSAGFTATNGVTVGSSTTLDPATYTHTIGSALNVNGTLGFTSSTGVFRTQTSGTTTLTMGANGLIRTVDATGLGPVSNASLQTQGSGVWSIGNSETVGTIEYYNNATQTITDRNYNNLIITNTGNKTWTPAATRTVNGNITVQGACITSGSNTVNLTGNMLISSGGSLTCSGSPTYNVSGNWTNSGSFTPATSTINFVNTGSGQTINGTVASQSFYNLGVTKSAQSLSLGGSLTSLTISNQLALNSGVMLAGAIPVIISTSTPGAVTSSGGYVNGSMQRRVTNGSGYLFAVGTGAGYTPASYDFSSVTGTGSVTIQSNDGAGSLYPSTLHASKRLARNWQVTKTGITSYSANASFNYQAADLSGGAADANLHPYIASPSVSYPTFTTTSNSFSVTSVTADGEIGAGECLGTLGGTFTKTKASSCNGGTDGTITVSGAGGTNPLNYSWTGPGGYSASTAAISGLVVGDYTIVIKDVSGCSFTIPDITILQALTPALTNNATLTATCINDGTITLYATLGVSPYTYSLDGVNYQASNNFAGLGAGSYTAYVKDVRGCVGTKAVSVAAVAPLGLSSASTPSGSCVNNGQLVLTRSGGKAPFTYSKDGVTYQAGNTFTNLAVGSYTCYVKDVKGCIASKVCIITGISSMTPSATAGASGSCTSNGTINLFVAGGKSPFTYSTNDITYVNSNNFTGLTGNQSYTCWIKDANGCKVSIPVFVALAPAVSASARHSNSSGCASDGSIQGVAITGTQPFSYSLNGINFQGSNSFSGLASGAYTLTVKDATGCTTTVGVSVGSNSLSATSITGPASSCASSNGYVKLLPVGGNGSPYQYSMDGVNYVASPMFTGLNAGTYTGYVKDGKSCVASTVCVVGPSCPRLPITKLQKPIPQSAEFGLAYPNPSNGGFNIELNPLAKKTHIEVTDITGHVVSVAENAQGKSVIRLGQNWKPGIYFLKIIQDEAVKTIRLIKQ